uniref:Uncharacterized protein n=1 Tax=Opuntia streptacantha TaxID=393608 RepID=A0A7C8ZWD5_OPUST
MEGLISFSLPFLSIFLGEGEGEGRGGVTDVEMKLLHFHANLKKKKNYTNYIDICHTRRKRHRGRIIKASTKPRKQAAVVMEASEYLQSSVMSFSSPLRR